MEKTRDGNPRGSPEKHSWFTIDRFYLKSNVYEIPKASILDESLLIEDQMNKLTQSDKDILRSKNSCLNYHLTDVTQKLICQTYNNFNACESVLRF